MSIRVCRSLQSEWQHIKQTSITLTEETPFSITIISPVQGIVVLAYVQIITLHAQDCTMHIFSPIMLALCLMLFSTYYAQNYAGIIGSGLLIAS